jgi:hypothetical protein
MLQGFLNFCPNLVLIDIEGVTQGLEKLSIFCPPCGAFADYKVHRIESLELNVHEVAWDVLEAIFPSNWKNQGLLI